jgi:cyclohexanone monooxygenase
VSQTSSLGASNALDAIVVGAGFAGLRAAHQLTQMGLSFQCFEAGNGVGGTWYWNRYPGAQCDVESMEYSYSFSDELQQEWKWDHKYSAQPQILAYANHVADRFDLRRHIRFDTRMVSAAFDESNALWSVTLSSGDTVQARFLLMGTGNLSTPRVPDISGISRFKGDWYHSSRWPQAGLEFTGKRVAVIGTGSTGIQIIPIVARAAKHLTVFQRSPNFVVQAFNRPLSSEEVSHYKSVYPHMRERARQSNLGVADIDMPNKSALEDSPKAREARYEALWARGSHPAFLSAYNDLLVNPEANETAAAFVRGKIRKAVQDPKVADLLCPKDHPIGTKRLCAGTDYYETYNRQNVTLVDARSYPIEEITERGLRCGGVEHEADVIVFATGFDAMTGALREIEIRGRGGRTLEQHWAAGPMTYLGLMVADFPNMFVITGPGSPSVKSNVVLSIEQHVDWIARCLADMKARAIATIEPEPEAQTQWVSHVNEVADRTLYPRADSWYTGSNVPGKPRVFMPYVGGIANYRRICDDVAAAGYRGFRLTPQVECV